MAIHIILQKCRIHEKTKFVRFFHPIIQRSLKNVWICQKNVFFRFLFQFFSKLLLFSNSTITKMVHVKKNFSQCEFFFLKWQKNSFKKNLRHKFWATFRETQNWGHCDRSFLKLRRKIFNYGNLALSKLLLYINLV